MNHAVTILMTEFVTHDVKRFIVTRPEGFEWQAGQGIELFIDHPDWKNEEGRPFTPTCLPDDRVLEFTIKKYPEHHAVTEKLHSLRPGNGLLISDPFGTISYKGPGIFIAGGAGITPFLGILRQLAQQGNLEGNGLFFSNKTPADIICEKEFRHYLGDRCVLTCTRESAPGYEDRHITKEFLEEKIADFGQHFYVCGPDPFVESINDALKDLGAAPDSLVFEE